MATPQSAFRFSGHETFVCRYAWLPKAIREVDSDPALFKRDEVAMVALGVGKNMVQSIRFWAESAQVIEQTDKGFAVSGFGRQLLGRDGHDPFLEEIKTLWLLHWKIATNRQQPNFYWQQLLNYWHRSEFSESQIVPFFSKNTPAGANLKSDSTLEQGYRVFVNTYVATRGRKGEVAEENLDSPLVELELVRRVGDRGSGPSGGREAIHAFNLEDKPTVTPELFAYCLNEFWKENHSEEKTLPFRLITAAPGSPGQVFKLPEAGVRARLELLRSISGGCFVFEESASIQQVVRKKNVIPETLLENVYSGDS